CAWRVDIGHRQQASRTVRRRSARQDRIIGNRDLVHPAQATRTDAGSRASGGGMKTAWIIPAILAAAVLLLAGMNLVVPAGVPLHASAYTISLAGKYLSYAILALSLDLVWGYAGILSLGHSAFFALGGYAMGMHLMREIGARGVYGNAQVPDFM